MSVIEGHAEHVMDACAASSSAPASTELRRRLDAAARRSRRARGRSSRGCSGMDMKLRQYELGKAFCDRVAAEAGADGLRLVWRSPDDLPDLDELEAPERWLERVGPRGRGLTVQSRISARTCNRSGGPVYKHVFALLQ